MITCQILVDFKLSMIKMQIKGWFRAYFCLLSLREQDMAEDRMKSGEPEIWCGGGTNGGEDA